MIPILPLVNVISLAFCLLAVLRLRDSVRKTPFESVGYFFRAYIAVTFYFFLMALPGMLADSFLIQLVFMAAYIPGFLAIYFLLQLLIHIHRKDRLKIALRWGLALFLVGITASNIAFFQEARFVPVGENFYLWGEGTPYWLQAVAGAVLGTMMAVGSGFFLYAGFRFQNRLARVRALLIGGGLGVMLAGAFSNYFLFSFVPGDWRLSVILIGGFLGLIGLIIMFFGVYYKRPESGAVADIDKAQRNI